MVKIVKKNFKIVASRNHGLWTLFTVSGNEILNKKTNLNKKQTKTEIEWFH